MSIKSPGLINAGPVSRFIYPVGNLSAISAYGNASISVQYVPVQQNVTATRVDALFSLSGGSAATTATFGIALSAYCGIYTRNVSTLSSVSSGSTHTTYTYASNTAGLTMMTAGNINPISVPVNMFMTEGEYFVAFNVVTAFSSIGLSTTDLSPLTMSVLGGNAIQSAGVFAEITNQTVSTSNMLNGQGVYTAASTGLPGTIGISNIAQTGASLSQANIALVFRNY